MKYSKEYAKLGLKRYTTIRRNLKGKKVGDLEKEYVNEKTWYAKIFKIKKMPLAEIPFQLLLNDCKPFAETRKECYALFQSFYRNPIDFENEPFYIFYMQKVNEGMMEMIIDIVKQSAGLWKWITSEGYIKQDGIGDDGEPLYKVSEKGKILLNKGYDVFLAEFKKWIKGEQ